MLLSPRRAADAKKPEDWDDEEDGDWEAPRIINPKCEKAPGCGEWKRPTKLVSGAARCWEGAAANGQRCVMHVSMLRARARPAAQPPRNRTHPQNPAYKGKWSAPLIDNPAYKGEWKPRDIPNPDYFKDPKPLSNIGKVGAGQKGQYGCWRNCIVSAASDRTQRRAFLCPDRRRRD